MIKLKLEFLADEETKETTLLINDKVMFQGKPSEATPEQLEAIDLEFNNFSNIMDKAFGEDWNQYE